MFRELACLKSLVLDHNKVECLLEGVFADLVNLEELSIAHNKIAQVSEGTFAGLVKLHIRRPSQNPQHYS